MFSFLWPFLSLLDEYQKIALVIAFLVIVLILNARKILPYITPKIVSKYKNKRLMRKLMNELKYVLADENLQPEQDGSFLIFEYQIYAHQRDVFSITFDENDPYFFGIRHHIYTFEEDEKEEISNIINSLNTNIKHACIVVLEKDIFIHTDAYTESHLDVKNVFLRLFAIVLYAQEEFRKEILNYKNALLDPNK